MRAPPRPIYRSRQFFASLRPRVDASLREEAGRLLGEPQQRLFESMTPRDQQHCLDVYRRLRDAGHDDVNLLIAALLHDAGKGEVATWHRVTYVVLQAAAPGLLRRVTRSSTSGASRAALYRLVHHEELGAQLARAAACSERTVALIRGDPHAGLEALHAADDES